MNWSKLRYLPFILCIAAVAVYAALAIEAQSVVILNRFLPEADSFQYYEMAMNRTAGADYLPNLHLPVYPAYLHFLVGIFTLFGRGNLLAVRIIQGLLTGSAGLILYFCIRRLLNELSAVIGMILFLFYRMTVMQTVLILPEALALFLMSLCLYLYLRYRDKKSPVVLIMFSIFMAVLASIKGLFLLIFALFAIAETLRLFRYRKLTLFLFLLAGISLHAFCFALLKPETSLGQKWGIHFFIGNNAAATGLFQSVPGVKNTVYGHIIDAELIAKKESASRADSRYYWLKRGVKFIFDHPARAIQLYLRKVLFLITNFEIENDSSYYYLQTKVFLLNLPFINFAVIGSLFCVGFCSSFAQRNKSVFLYISTGILLAGVLSIFICSRYRMQLLLPLTVFAACGADTLISLFKNKKWVNFSLVSLAFLSCYGISLYPLSTLSIEKDKESYKKRENTVTAFSDKRDSAEKTFTKDLTDFDTAFKTAEEMRRSFLYKKALFCYGKALPLATNDDQKLKVLQGKALLFEKMFDFHGALNLFQEAEKLKPSNSFIKRKINELKILTDNY